MTNTGLHSCSDLDILNREDAFEDRQCLDDILRQYIIVRHLNSGENADVLLIQHVKTQRYYALKVNIIGDDENDDDMMDVAQQGLTVACMLNNLGVEDTRIFVHTYGWISCTLDISQTPLGKYIDGGENAVLFTVMEYASVQFSNLDIELTDREYLFCLFALIHGLFVARKQIRFSHEDIHQEQILLIPTSDAQISLGNGYLLDSRDVRYFPKLIDYDYGEYGDIEANSDSDSDDLFDRSEGSAYPSTDISSLRRVFLTQFKRRQTTNSALEQFFRSKAWKRAERSTRVEWEPLELLLKHQVFDSLIVSRIQERVSFCHNCTGAASVQCSKTGYIFCDEPCRDAVCHIVK